MLELIGVIAVITTGIAVILKVLNYEKHFDDVKMYRVVNGKMVQL